MDRFDLRLDVPAVSLGDLDLPASGATSAEIAANVARARAAQATRFSEVSEMHLNADAEGALLEEIAAPDAEGRAFLLKAADKFGLTARGYHRILRVARTIADLEGAADVRKAHIAEAVSFRVGGVSGS